MALGELQACKFPAVTMKFPLLHSWTSPFDGVQKATAHRKGGGDWTLPGFRTIARLRHTDMTILRTRDHHTQNTDTTKEFVSTSTKHMELVPPNTQGL